jgi:hypothetical protein
MIKVNSVPQERACAVCSFDFFDNFWNAYWKHFTLFKSKDLFFGRAGISA